MALKIFLTGATGYIGGDAFYALYEAHPEYDYTLLIRNEERGKAVAEKYPKVRLVYGTLDSADVIEKEAAAADIVIHTADSSDNVPSAKAIAKGLAAGHSAEKPGYWLHVCGTGILQWYDEQEKRYGQPPLPEQTYNDIEGIDRLLNLPDGALHRDVDKIVLPANDSAGVKTAILCPPTIYGPGRGPGNRRSIQVYDMAKFMLKNGYAPIVGTGLVEWDNVHVHDLSAFFVQLVEATQGPAHKADPEVFGPHGYFFLANGTHAWGDVARWLAEAAYKQGFMAEAKTETMTMEALCQMLGVPTISLGTNSKGVAERARKYLGWTPKGRSLKDEIPDIVAGEAKAMGIEPTGHKH